MAPRQLSRVTQHRGSSSSDPDRAKPSKAETWATWVVTVIFTLVLLRLIQLLVRDFWLILIASVQP